MKQISQKSVDDKLRTDAYQDLLCQVATIPEVCKIFNLKIQNVTRWATEGRIAASQYKDGKTWIVAIGSVKDYLDKK